MRAQRRGGVVTELRAHPGAFDAALAGLLALLSTVSLWVSVDYLTVDFRDPDLLGVALTLVSTLPLAWRRRRPLLTLLVVGSATVLVSALEYVQVLGGVAVAIAVYTAAAYCGRRRGLLGLGAALLGYLTIVAVDQFPTSGVDIVANSAVLFGAWAFGRSMRLRRAYTAQLEARAATMDREREAELRAGVAEERSRIARELHDVVAHHVSVMTVQAAAARRTLDRDPARSREALLAVEETGRTALDEMRRLVGVLRRADHGDAEGLAPAPGLADLPELVEQVREAGLVVDVLVRGEPRPLPPGVDLTLYRIVQEALTNTLKHGGRTHAHVLITYGNADVGVSVGDEGRGLAAGLAGEHGRAGHGLLGMRERVGMYGGELYTGPRPGGGFLVRARIPTGRATAGSEPAARVGESRVTPAGSS